MLINLGVDGVSLKWNKSGAKSIVRRLSVPINTDVKDILKKDSISYNYCKTKSDRDYSEFNWDSLYANIF